MPASQSGSSPVCGSDCPLSDRVGVELWIVSGRAGVCHLSPHMTPPFQPLRNSLPRLDEDPALTAYLIRRSLILVASLFVAAIVLFVLLRLLPGDPANALLGGGGDAGADRGGARAGRLGPAARPRSSWPLSASSRRFDLGTSFVSDAPVLPEIGNRLSVTLPLTLLGFVLAIVIAVPLGIVAAVKADRWYGGADLDRLAARHRHSGVLARHSAGHGLCHQSQHLSLRRVSAEGLGQCSGRGVRCRWRCRC